MGFVETEQRDISWMRCVTCLRGFVRNGSTISPATRPKRTPSNLPADDALVWEEVRTCLGAGAYMAAVMLCRKLLLHIAVENGLPEENVKGFGPGFKQCVQHLETAGVITKQMLDWVEPIKDIGNTATHKIKAITQAEAEQVATFTEQLLVLAYELRAATPVSPARDDDEPDGARALQA
ncbi:DUF4145 domain-containing protein [Nocardioides sp. QY071]|uniref:DUF4145 domain-containing protein n=1 Tax=Nocardioides sp. QY071 TaxID=3044187 RepID=UPI00249B0ADA|nr:DUF4145 domain-containing protein [Nocardioides sp. QY071]WGY03717.1 DUF4145 domain-containing protein [Nocardioides sp. QY071]